jgi:hypothetical protein
MNRLVCDHESLSVLLEVKPPQLPDSLVERIVEEGYQPKDSHHVTVVPREAGQRLGSEGFAELSRSIGSLPVPTVIFHDAMLHHIAKPKEVDGVQYNREALVLPCVSEGLEALTEDLVRVGVLAAQPFPHVTMYTKGDEDLPYKGIGINSDQEWRQLNPQPYANWQEGLL